jgi:hypothetical protein
MAGFVLLTSMREYTADAPSASTCFRALGAMIRSPPQQNRVRFSGLKKEHRQTGATKRSPAQYFVPHYVSGSLRYVEGVYFQVRGISAAAHCRRERIEE